MHNIGDNMTHRPTVFVGSSSEGKQIAKEVQQALKDVADVTIWSQGIFQLNHSYLEDLISASETADFAIFVLTPDDVTESRDQQLSSPRDNVVFEFGLFLGCLGRDRCFTFHDKSQDIKIPSDLFGISSATFSPHSDGNLEAAVGSGCRGIEKCILKKGRRPRQLNTYVHSYRLPAIHGSWKGTATQEDGPDGHPLVAEVTATFDARSTQIVGNGTFRFTRPEGEELEARYKFNGGFLFDQFLRIEYDSEEQFRIQFGSIVLELGTDAKSLHGRFQGYGLLTKRIIHGTLKLTKA